MANQNKENNVRYECAYSTGIVRKVIESIPDNWFSIDGHLCAPQEAIDSGNIAKGCVWDIQGKTLSQGHPGYGLSNLAVDFCQFLHGDNNKCVPRNIDYHDSSEVCEMINKKPCGINFTKAGSFTSPRELKLIKQIILDQLDAKYTLMYIDAFSDITLKSSQRRIYFMDSEPTVSSAPEMTSLRCDLKDEKTYLDLQWNPELGGSVEKLNSIFKDVLKDMHLYKEEPF